MFTQKGAQVAPFFMPENGGSEREMCLVCTETGVWWVNPYRVISQLMNNKGEK